MTNLKIKMNTKLLMLIAAIWFLIISFITAQTEYQRIIADTLADPRGTSTQFEGVLNILIVIISFTPSGFLISYPYVMKNYRNHRAFRTVVLSLVIAFILLVPFGWYNFYVNFGR